MAPRPRIRFWRRCRIYFRRFRIFVWLLILFLIGSVIYVNQVGVPGFFKRPLLEKLRASGIDLQFSRLRLRWIEGLVAENVHFGQAAPDVRGPQVTADEVQVRVNHEALRHFQLQVDSLLLRRGTVSWTVPGTNAAPREISVQDIQTDLRLLPGDQWQLDHFTARFANAHIVLSGSVTNASAVRDWKLFHAPGPAAPAGLWERRLRTLADTLEQIKFSATPDLRLDVRGDARDLLSFKARLFINSPGAETPWGSFNQGKFTVRVVPGGTGELSQAQITLDAADAQTKWATTTNLHLNVQLISPLENTNLIHGECTLTAASVQSKWGGVTDTSFNAKWIHALTNPIPIEGHGELNCSSAQTEFANSGPLHIVSQLISATNDLAPAENVIAQAAPRCEWLNLNPYHLTFDVGVQSLQTTQASLAQLNFSGEWLFPKLVLSNLDATLFGGAINASANLDVVTRALRATLASTIDPHKFSPVLTEGGNRFLDQFTWNSPPVVNGTVSVVLPEWTNRAPDWRGEVLPTLRIDGHFAVTNGGAFRGVTAKSARSNFIYSNMIWMLSDLVAIRDEGRLEAAVGSSRVDLQACKLEYSIVSPK